MNKLDVLNRMLKVGAMQHGLCEKWTREWGEDNDVDSLCEKFKNGLDFCIANDWPSKEFLDEMFDKEELARRGIYDGYAGIDGGGNGTIVVQHGSSGELHFGGYDAATVWVRHDSELYVSVCGHAWAFVHVYDNANVTVEKNGCDSKVIVKRHSADAMVLTRGDVKRIDPYA